LDIIPLYNAGHMRVDFLTLFTELNHKRGEKEKGGRKEDRGGEKKTKGTISF
jgi:hypothetical protein